MKKNQNSGRDMANVRKSNVSDPTIQGIKGHVDCYGCSGFNPVAAYNELIECPLDDLCAGAALCMLNGEFQNAKFTLGVAAREGSIPAMFGLARFLIYGLVPNVDFDLDILPLVYKAANHYHIPSMWMMARWLYDGVLLPKNEELAEFWFYMVSQLDPNAEHVHPVIDYNDATNDDISILVADVIDALEYNPDEVFEPDSEEDVLKKFFKETE